ncbi:MAG: hypothetical protein AB8U54_06835, partial [Rickettsia conorii subsp. raoultii]
IENNLSFEDVLPKTDKLKQLIDIVNYYKQLEDNAKTIGNFLETVKKLNQLLETPKSENKLENLLNYLKYLSNIKFSEKENLVTLNSAKWFNDLFSNLGAYNIKEKLLESFKHTICKDKDSFYNKLNETIEKFYEDIKNNDVLDLKAINNIIYNLKNFLQHINNSSTDVENLDNIKLFLTKSFKNFNNILGITINNSISNLEKLIGSVSKQDAKSLWKYITASKSITEISQNLDKVIYDKLLHQPVLPDQALPIYNLLEKLLKETHKSINDCYKNENLYKHQLAEIYCQQAQICTPNGSTKLSKDSIGLYENAANLGSEEANIKLGKIEFKSGNYVKALEYFKNTTHISYAKEAFNKLLHLKESELKKKIQQKNPQDIAKLASEIIELYSSQGDFYNQYNLDISEKSLQDSLKVFCLNTKALIEEQGRPKPYGILYDLSKELTSIISSPCSQLKFIQKTEKYKNLAEKFKEEKLETDYTNITTSWSHDSYFKEPLLKFDDLKKP